MAVKGGKGRAAVGGGRAGSDLFSRMLGFVEKAGNTLPHPATIFLVLTAKADEVECPQFFGPQYQDYMKKTKMFLPFLF